MSIHISGIEKVNFFKIFEGHSRGGLRSEEEASKGVNFTAISYDDLLTSHYQYCKAATSRKFKT